MKHFKTSSNETKVQLIISFHFFLRHRRYNASNDAKLLLLILCSRFFRLPAQRLVRRMGRSSSQSQTASAPLVTSYNSPLYSSVTICLILVLLLFGARFSVISNARNLPAPTFFFHSASSQVNYDDIRHSSNLTSLSLQFACVAPLSSNVSFIFIKLSRA